MLSNKVSSKLNVLSCDDATFFDTDMSDRITFFFWSSTLAVLCQHIRPSSAATFVNKGDANKIKKKKLYITPWVAKVLSVDGV